MGVPFLGRVPLDAAVASAGDRGRPTVLADEEGPAGRSLKALTRAVRERLEASPPRR
jgi:hypothetical protein